MPGKVPCNSCFRDHFIRYASYLGCFVLTYYTQSAGPAGADDAEDEASEEEEEEHHDEKQKAEKKEGEEEAEEEDAAKPAAAAAGANLILFSSVFVCPRFRESEGPFCSLFLLLSHFSATRAADR